MFKNYACYEPSRPSRHLGGANFLDGLERNVLEYMSIYNPTINDSHNSVIEDYSKRLSELEGDEERD